MKIFLRRILKFVLLFLACFIIGLVFWWGDNKHYKVLIFQKNPKAHELTYKRVLKNNRNLSIVGEEAEEIQKDHIQAKNVTLSVYEGEKKILEVQSPHAFFQKDQERIDLWGDVKGHWNSRDILFKVPSCVIFYAKENVESKDKIIIHNILETLHVTAIGFDMHYGSKNFHLSFHGSPKVHLKKSESNFIKNKN